MCEDKEEVRAAGRGARETSPTRLCWGNKPPPPLPDTRGMCCAKLLRKNGKPKKAVFGQQCQCSGNNLGNIGISNIGAGWGGNAGWGNQIGGASSNCGLGLGNIGAGSQIISSGYSIAGPSANNAGPSINNAGYFTVSSASPVYDFPGGVVVTSENQIGGQVSVSGATPFLAAAYFGGDVPSTGESTLSYNAGPSVSLNGGGSGTGWGGANAGSFGGIGGLGGLGGASIASGLSGIAVGGQRSCNCGY